MKGRSSFCQYSGNLALPLNPQILYDIQIELVSILELIYQLN